MNGFLIAVGGYVPDLTEYAKSVAAKIGKGKVDMGKTACKVPDLFPILKKRLPKVAKRKRP